MPDFKLSEFPQPFLNPFRCNGLVFEAEKQVAKNAVYHKKCFTCIKCKHQLDASNFINGPDDVYCVHCYKVRQRLFLWSSVNQCKTK